MWPWSPFQGVRGSQEGLSAGGVDHVGPWWTRPFIENPALIGWAYTMPEWQWWLCMFSWWSCYVRWWWDGFQHSRVYCQVDIGVCGYVLSCLALNGFATWGHQLLGHLLSSGNLQAWLPKAWVHAEPGHKEELDRAHRWWNSTRPRPLWGDKRDWCGLWPDLILLSWWFLPFRQKWWDHIRYEVLVSQTVCHWRKYDHIHIC
jgi:hypothetical protein